MLIRGCFIFALLMALPAWSQVAPEASGGETNADQNSDMMMPPPVSNAPYPAVTGDEMRSNYLSAGLTVNAGYDDNVLPYYVSTPISSMIYSIGPNITINQLTPRMQNMVSYSPGYTFYQNVSARNEADQNASINFQYRISPHLALNASDAFHKSSNIFNEPYGAISGEPVTSVEGAIAPFADNLANGASGGLSYQINSSAMIGGSGTMTKLIYPNPSEVSGLYNSNMYGGSVFYNRRLNLSQYTGVTYQYANNLADPGPTQSEIQTHTLYFFYSYYWTHTFSVSISGGPQYYDIGLPGLPAETSWTPAVTASLGWQAHRTDVSAKYSRSVTGGGGLLGAYESSSASASVVWQITRNWSVACNGGYNINKSVDAALTSSSEQGHSISGSASASRPFGRHVTASFEYDRMHLSYADVAVLAADPNTDHESVSVSYHFDKSLGR